MSRSRIARPASPSLEIYRFKLTKVLERLASGRREWESFRFDRNPPPPRRDANELALFCRRHLPAHRTDWTSFLTRQVSDALDRIDNGSYGRCLQCGHTIATDRLAAVPWVALCAACQEANVDNRA